MKLTHIGFYSTTNLSYTVTVPALPGCITYGETVNEAITMAKEAIELYIKSLVEHNEPVPVESST